MVHRRGQTLLGPGNCLRSSVHLLLVMLVCVLHCPAVSAGGAGTKRKLTPLERLKADLLSDGYSTKRMIRPVYSENASLTVRLAIKLSDIASFELNENKAFTQISLCISWYPRSPGGWNPKDYGGITNFTVDTSEVWRPDIEVFNHVDFPEMFSHTSYFAVVDSSGIVEWCPAGRIVVSCDTDMSHFPHDEHECSLLIGSATYDHDKLRLEPSLIEEPDDVQLKRAPAAISTNWQIIETGFELVKGGHSDFFDYACKLRIRVRRRFSLHLYTFSLVLFCCAGLTVTFCWLPLADEKRFQLALLSVIVNIFLMIRYSDTLQHSTSTPWGLRFAGDLLLFTCCMIVLQMLCLVLEEVLVPFASHPVVDQFLSTTIVSTYILNERHNLLEEEVKDEQGQAATPEAASGSGRDAGSGSDGGPFGRPPSRITTETTVISDVNEKWRDLLVALMRISVTLFLLAYALTYYVLDRYGIF